MTKIIKVKTPYKHLRTYHLEDSLAIPSKRNSASDIRNIWAEILGLFLIILGKIFIFLELIFIFFRVDFNIIQINMGPKS